MKNTQKIFNLKTVEKSLLGIIQQTAHEKNITQQEIAATTGLLQSNISRVFSGKYSPNLSTFIKICQAVGLAILVETANTEIHKNR